MDAGGGWIMFTYQTFGINVSNVSGDINVNGENHTQFRCPSNNAAACSRTCSYASFLPTPAAKFDESACTWIGDF
jgi:hypothetical protein